ncbi:MAG: phrB [Vampirovibrio sp.]|jgi:deoxyribodipyrimidine photo-lyase|nr:phrB [Vampirovibrio sp.]
MSQDAVLLWFRQDLRLADNPALYVARQTNGLVIPVYIDDLKAAAEWQAGSADRVWLHGSLSSLQQDLRSLQSELILRQGPTLHKLIELARETGARHIHCNARYEPWAIRQEQALQQALADQGIELVCHRGASLLWEPGTIQTGDRKPYQVFTPFFKKCLQSPPELDVIPRPKTLKAPAQWPKSLAVEELNLLPRLHWHRDMQAFWQPGEAQAQRLLNEFIQTKQDAYSDARNIPSIDGTSRLSPYLSHGEISPRQIWQAVAEDGRRSGTSFLREIVWREFAYHVLYHFPHTTDQALKAKFNQLPWTMRQDWFERWIQGQTGYPVVDAGMRQLWRIGWMHNRVRMIVGSFLTKDLLIGWQDGARWFWDTLLDADLAQNSLNWQWVAGCGADAQPFFRIFNPVTQGQKFDPDGRYVRQWVPELAQMPAKYIHAPWTAPDSVLRQAGIQLGNTYPEPMVDHGTARNQALKIYKQLPVSI